MAPTVHQYGSKASFIGGVISVVGGQEANKDTVSALIVGCTAGVQYVMLHTFGSGKDGCYMYSRQVVGFM